MYFTPKIVTRNKTPAARENESPGRPGGKEPGGEIQSAGEWEEGGPRWLLLAADGGRGTEALISS